MNKELLHKFFDRSANPQEEKVVIDWLESDPKNERVLFAERRLFDAMLIHSNNAAKVNRKLHIPQWIGTTLRYAAILAIVLGIGYFYTSKRDAQLMAAMNTLKVPAGQCVELILSDGTKVNMNALSEISYPAVFTKGKRVVSLKGEAFFEVSHDAEHPFIVETYACNVEVLGTKFNVEARPEYNQFSTSLVEGSVRVSDNNDASKQVILKPQECLTFEDNAFRVTLFPEYEEFQWREGLITFRDATFTELMRKFEQYYGMTIEIDSRSTPSKLFTGKIRISEGLDHALRVLQQSASFNYERSLSNDTIYIK